MPSTHGPRRLAAVVLALLCAAALTACGDASGSGGSGEDPDRSSRFADELESMPGVVSAEVEEEVVEGEGIEQLDVGLVVADDAAADDVTALLDAVASYDAELGFDQHHSLVVQRDGLGPGRRCASSTAAEAAGPHQALASHPYIWAYGTGQDRPRSRPSMSSFTGRPVKLDNGAPGTASSLQPPTPTRT